MDIPRGSQQQSGGPFWYATLAPAPDLPPWYAAKAHRLGTRLVFVTFVCPRGHASCLSARVHSIRPDGTVSPSYVCPHKRCFHQFIQLTGWGEGFEHDPRGQQ